MCNNKGNMKTVIILLTLALNGCALTAVSTASYITTGKSITDHATSTLTRADCDVINYVTGRQDYYCERAREPGTTYNRNSF